MGSNPWENYGGGKSYGGGTTRRVAPRSRPPTVKPASSSSSRFNPNRNLATRGNDRIAGRTTTSAPTRGATNTTSRQTTMALQRRLNAQGANLTVDGIMGPKTRAAQNKYSGGGSSGTPSGSSGAGSSGGYTGGDFSGGFSGGSYGSAADRSAAVTQSTADLASLRQERLKAALAAIGAQFDFEEGSLNANLGDLRNEFNQLEARNARTGERNIEGIGDAAAERGLFQSGINAKATAEEFGRQAEEKADLVGRLGFEEGAEGTEVRNIRSAIAMLAQQQASAEGTAKLDAEKDELDLAQLVALVGAGLQ